MTLKIDQIFDLDEDTVTSDIALNNFLHSAPELNLKFDQFSMGKIKVKQETTIARYQESRYDSTTKKIRKFPDIDAFSYAPNTYIFRQDATIGFDKLPQKTNFRFNIGYDQYIFKIQDYGYSEGDALYSFNLNASQTSEFLTFIKMNTSYQTQYAPKENNSPFYEFQKSITEQNKISETITFFYTKNSLPFFPYYLDLSWSHATDYNWIKEDKKWGNYTTKFKAKATRKLSFSAQTGKKLNFSESEKATRFQPLRLEVALNPTQNIVLNFDISYDLNTWKDEQETDINNSKFNLSFFVGKNPEYRWEIKTGFIYDTAHQNGRWEATRYDMQTINIVKHEHKRKLELGYRKLAEELTIKYTFNAFPDDPLELRKMKDIWKVEGRFDKGSEERLK